MTQNRLFPLVGLAAGLLFLLSQIFFTVQQGTQAIVLQFGELVAVHEAPGLKVKIPFIQTVITYDARLLNYRIPVIEVTAGDQKRLAVDMYTRYLIKDPLLFFKKVQNKGNAENRMSSIVDASMRRVIGRVPLADLLSQNRAAIMDAIQKDVVKAASTFGVQVVDVRIIRADLPGENSEAIFKRMETERRQEAKQFRAEGDEMAQKVRASADRQRVEILADARKQSEIVRGQGEAEASQIYADAFQKDPAFFEIWRTLEAYRASLRPEDTTMVLTKDSPFFKFFENQ
ncbi:MAG: protease modulator HflC [Candidatus Puniceispirillum sp.]|nr:protease modulator HflC [Candidatus Puniceispirillum sp.]